MQQQTGAHHPDSHTTHGAITDYNHASKLAMVHHSNCTKLWQEESTPHLEISDPEVDCPHRSSSDSPPPSKQRDSTRDRRVSQTPHYTRGTETSCPEQHATPAEQDLGKGEPEIHTT